MQNNFREDREDEITFFINFNLTKKLSNMNETILDDTHNDSNHSLTQASISYLKETAKWCQFLSIIGFIFLGFILLGALGMIIFGSAVNSSLAASQAYGGGFPFPTTLVAVLYLVVGVLYFFPIYYLFNFATKMRRATFSGGSQEIEEAFKNLKSHYKFVGIFTIIMLSIYVLIFLFGLML